MNRKTGKETEATTKTAEETAQTGKAAARKPGVRGTLVYCGPTVRGVAKQYTVYTGGAPAELEEFLRTHRAAERLLVPIEKFAETRRKLEKPGTAEAMVYRAIKSEL